LLQINAFPESTPSKSKIEGGWFQAIIGPLLTLFSVRDTTQLSRVSTEVELLQKRWANQVKIAYCPIFFPKNGKNGEYKPPLSWTLTEKQKQNIKNGWCGIKEEIGKQIGSSRLCVIIFAYEIVKCLLGKTFRTILLNKLSV
jgi:Zn-finger protein